MAKTLKIGIDARPLSFLRAGIKRYVQELVSALSGISSNNQYCLISSAGFPYLPGGGNFSKKVLKLPNRGIFKNIWESFVLPQFLQHNKIDVFHGTRYYVPNVRGVKLVSTIHDLAFKTHPQFVSRRAYYYFDRAVKRAIERAGSIITCSFSCRRDLVSYYSCPEGKIQVIYEGASEKFFPVNEEEKREFRRRKNINYPFILFVGTIQPRKNILNTVKAFLAAGLSGYKMVICGQRGWAYKELFDYLKEKDALGKIVFFDYVSEEDLNLFYNCADLFFYCPFAEGFGFPPLEAQRCGIPVVASKIGVFEEVLGKSAVFVDPSNIAHMADVLGRVLNNAELKKELKEKGKENAARFSWHDCARKTLEVYQNV